MVSLIAGLLLQDWRREFGLVVDAESRILRGAEELAALVFLWEKLQRRVEDGGGGGGRIEDDVVLLRRGLGETEGDVGLDVQLLLGATIAGFIAAGGDITGEQALTSPREEFAYWAA
jgi:hypothetical protein